MTNKGFPKRFLSGLLELSDAWLLSPYVSGQITALGDTWLGTALCPLRGVFATTFRDQHGDLEVNRAVSLDPIRVTNDAGLLSVTLNTDSDDFKLDEKTSKLKTRDIDVRGSGAIRVQSTTDSDFLDSIFSTYGIDPFPKLKVLQLKASSFFSQTNGTLSVASRTSGCVPFYSSADPPLDINTRFTYNGADTLTVDYVKLGTSLQLQPEYAVNKNFLQQYYQVQSGSGLDINAEIAGSNRRIIQLRLDASTFKVGTTNNLEMLRTYKSPLVLTKTATASEVSLSVDNQTLKVNASGQLYWAMTGPGIKLTPTSSAITLDIDSSLKFTGTQLGVNMTASKPILITGKDISLSIDSTTMSVLASGALSSKAPLVDNSTVGWTLDGKLRGLYTFGKGLTLSATTVVDATFQTCQYPLKVQNGDLKLWYDSSLTTDGAGNLSVVQPLVDNFTIIRRNDITFQDGALKGNYAGQGGISISGRYVTDVFTFSNGLMRTGNSVTGAYTGSGSIVVAGSVISSPVLEALNGRMTAAETELGVHSGLLTGLQAQCGVLEAGLAANVIATTAAASVASGAATLGAANAVGIAGLTTGAAVMAGNIGALDIATTTMGASILTNTASIISLGTAVGSLTAAQAATASGLITTNLGLAAVTSGLATEVAAGVTLGGIVTAMGATLGTTIAGVTANTTAIGILSSTLAGTTALASSAQATAVGAAGAAASAQASIAATDIVVGGHTAALALLFLGSLSGGNNYRGEIDDCYHYISELQLGHFNGGDMASTAWSNTTFLPKSILTSTTDSTTSFTGSMTLAGGLGVAKRLNVQGIAGFNAGVVCLSTLQVITPTASNFAASKGYVDGLIPTAGTGLTKTGVVFSVNASQTQITQLGSLTSLTVLGAVTASTTPTLGAHLVNKTYVDSLVAPLASTAYVSATYATLASVSTSISTLNASIAAKSDPLTANAPLSITSGVISIDLGSYVSIPSLQNTLTGYPTISGLISTLQPYATTQNLTDALVPYATQSALTSGLSLKESVLSFTTPLSRIGNAVSIDLSTYATQSALTSGLALKESILSFTAPLSRTGNSISISLTNYLTVANATSTYQPLLTAGSGLTKSTNTLSINPSQPTVTSLGTLTSLVVSGSASFGGLVTLPSTAPTLAQHAVTKAYADGLIAGLSTTSQTSTSISNALLPYSTKAVSDTLYMPLSATLQLSPTNMNVLSPLNVTGGDVSISRGVSAGVLQNITNTTNDANAYVALALRNSSPTALYLFLNSPSRTTDGGMGAGTLRNDGGPMRVMAGSTELRLDLNGAVNVEGGQLFVRSGGSEIGSFRTDGAYALGVRLATESFVNTRGFVTTSDEVVMANSQFIAGRSNLQPDVYAPHQVQIRGMPATATSTRGVSLYAYYQSGYPGFQLSSHLTDFAWLSFDSTYDGASGKFVAGHAAPAFLVKNGGKFEIQYASSSFFQAGAGGYQSVPSRKAALSVDLTSGYCTVADHECIPGTIRVGKASTGPRWSVIEFFSGYQEGVRSGYIGHQAGGGSIEHSNPTGSTYILPGDFSNAYCPHRFNEGVSIQSGPLVICSGQSMSYAVGAGETYNVMGPTQAGPNAAGTYNISIFAQNTIVSKGNLFLLSDEREKNDIEVIREGHGLKALHKIDPVHYRRKDDKAQCYGFVAQNVQKTLGEPVRQHDDLYVLDHNQLLSVLWAAVRDLSNEVKELNKSKGKN